MVSSSFRPDRRHGAAASVPWDASRGLHLRVMPGCKVCCCHTWRCCAPFPPPKFCIDLALYPAAFQGTICKNPSTVVACCIAFLCARVQDTTAWKEFAYALRRRSDTSLSGGRHNTGAFVMLVLYETAAGFALFKVLQEGKVAEAQDLWKDFETADSASKVGLCHSHSLFVVA